MHGQSTEIVIISILVMFIDLTFAQQIPFFYAQPLSSQLSHLVFLTFSTFSTFSVFI